MMMKWQLKRFNPTKWCSTGKMHLIESTSSWSTSSTSWCYHYIDFKDRRWLDCQQQQQQKQQHGQVMLMMILIIIRRHRAAAATGGYPTSSSSLRWCQRDQQKGRDGMDMTSATATTPILGEYWVLITISSTVPFICTWCRRPLRSSTPPPRRSSSASVCPPPSAIPSVNYSTRVLSFLRCWFVHSRDRNSRTHAHTLAHTI